MRCSAVAFCKQRLRKSSTMRSGRISSSQAVRRPFTAASSFASEGSDMSGEGCRWSGTCCASQDSASRLSSTALAAAVADKKCAIGCKGKATEKGTQECYEPGCHSVLPLDPNVCLELSVSLWICSDAHRSCSATSESCFVLSWTLTVLRDKIGSGPSPAAHRTRWAAFEDPATTLLDNSQKT